MPAPDTLDRLPPTDVFTDSSFVGGLASSLSPWDTMRLNQIEPWTDVSNDLPLATDSTHFARAGGSTATDPFFGLWSSSLGTGSRNDPSAQRERRLHLPDPVANEIRALDQQLRALLANPLEELPVPAIV